MQNDILRNRGLFIAPQSQSKIRKSKEFGNNYIITDVIIQIIQGRTIHLTISRVASVHELSHFLSLLLSFHFANLDTSPKKPDPDRLYGLEQKKANRALQSRSCSDPGSGT
jgi:hypothetical protein